MLHVDYGRQSAIRATMMARRRAKAAAAVARAVRIGDLPRPNMMRCFDCWRVAQCYDHRDYRKPLDVWPVCYRCDAMRGAAEPYDGADVFWMARLKATKKRLRELARKLRKPRA